MPVSYHAMSYIGPLKTSRSLLVLNWKSFGNNACAKFQVDTITGAELDQRSARRYNQRNLQYHQNKMFRNDQKLFYKELDGKTNEQTEAPDPKGSSEVCSKLWSKPVEHNRTKQENVIITAKKLKRALARMSNRKAAGPDHVQGFWFKKATSLHPQTQTTSTKVCECWSSTYMDDKRTHSTHHEIQVQRNSCRKLQTNCFPPTDVETVDKYILKSNVWTF